MDNKIVGIHQPNFMPWLGYFYKINQSDVFIFLDDVQFQKKGASYTNRVSININSESKYLTIPVNRNSGVWSINKTTFDDRFKKKLISSLQGNYAKAKYFKENKEFIFDLINFNTDNLADYNMHFILEICKKLAITTNIIKSSDFNITTTSTQRLIDLIKKVDGNVYLSGDGGDNYQEHEMYKNESIELIYNKMSTFKYKQLKTDEFIGGLSIVDAIFNIGFEDLKKGLFKNE
jgi:hypothetical protein